jgi:tungstate transport system ATP-binding protein
MPESSILPLHAQGLGFTAYGQSLLDDVSFVLPQGGISMILGANGSGKTLLLRMCHGLLEPTKGGVRWAGSGKNERLRHAMVFQKPVMLRRPALANVTHALRAAGHSRTEAARLGHEALARFGLGALASRPARLLSGGEQQRLAIARAAALKPDVLFLDEPSSQLDPGATRQIEEMLRTLEADGVTLLMATHDLGQARRLAKRVLFLHRGRLVEDAVAAGFFASPATLEARTFMKGDLPW